MRYPILKDFKFYKECSQEMLEKYKGALPENLLDVWKEYGFGSFGDGYFKLIDPSEYQEIFSASYFDPKDGIPFMVTSFGDLFVWKSNAYVYLLRYRYGNFSVAAKSMDFFFEDLEDDYFINKYLNKELYSEAKEVLGEPEYDECFGYVPILALGGKESVDHLEVVKTREHILVITQLAGGIG